MAIQEISINQQIQQLLDELPAEGLKELLWFTEFLQFKYRLPPPSESISHSSNSQEIPAESFTARYRGFIQSPLSVAELGTAYDISLMRSDN